MRRGESQMECFKTVELTHKKQLRYKDIYS